MEKDQHALQIHFITRMRQGKTASETESFKSNSKLNFYIYELDPERGKQ